MVLALIFIFLLTLVLILRLFNLQIIYYDYYTEESLGNQMRILPITPIRPNFLSASNVAGISLVFSGVNVSL
jgi:penicillin-binding protein 2